MRRAITIDGRYGVIEFSPDDVHVEINDFDPDPVYGLWSIEWTAESWEEAVVWLLANGYGWPYNPH